MYKAILKMVGKRPKLFFRGHVLRVCIGAKGLSSQKREGDLCTPTASLPLRRVFYRADRTPKPQCASHLLAEPLAPTDGWCDDPASSTYNRLVKLPCEASAERLWRDDHVYDICVVLGWNDAPALPGRGSAIFLHLPPASGVTEGCIALAEPELRALLAEGLAEIEITSA